MRKSFLLLALVAALLSTAPQARAAVFIPNGPTTGGGNSHASIVVVTNVINDNGGILLPAAFLMTYGDGLAAIFTFPGTPAPGASMSVAPGNYVVEGPDMSGYTRAYSVGCSGTLLTDSFVTCTVTYDDVDPSMTPYGDCEVASCEPITPPAGGCPLDSSDCVSPPVVATCDPLSPDCNPGTPQGETETPLTALTSDFELPRTGGSPLPEALALVATGIALSLRKRS